MAVGDPSIVTETVACTGATRFGVGVLAAAADGKIVSVMVKSKDPEVEIVGITLSNTADTAGSFLYHCAGVSTAVTYNVTFTKAIVDNDA